MDVASKDLCQQLYDLSGWDDQTWWHCYEWDVNGHRTGEQDVQPKNVIEYEDAETHKIVSAYDLGYLSRKLPPKLEIKGDTYGLVVTPCTSDGSWIADYLVASWGQPLADRDNHWLHHGDQAKLTEAESPEGAACKLAIELFKQGILKRDGEAAE